MKKTKILSSAFIMTMVSFGAFAADKTITEASTCTVDVLGTSDNNATANAIATWTLNEYTLNPGEYLNVTETDVAAATCPAGSYCVGGTGFTVDNAQTSIAQCPTGYSNSADGASADTQCYTACTVDMVAKATKVTGNDYYGTGTDTCEPTECVAGWHVKPGLNLTDTIGTTDTGTGWTSNDNTGTKKANISITPSDAGIAGEPMAFAVVYGDKGMITGRGRCSTQAGDNNDNTWTDPTIADNWPDETGADGAQYCYCQLDGYKSADGESAPIVAAPWVFLGDSSTGNQCASTCPLFCADRLCYIATYSSGFRAAVFGTVDGPATCAANTINIDWNPDNGGKHTINQCTYEGSVTLPTPDPVKQGYTFTGWKLLENTTTE